MCYVVCYAYICVYIYVTLNLITGLYTTYKKPNDNFLYINTSSDYPPEILKQLANSINKRLHDNSANELVFNTVKPVYENSLHDSGYKSSLNTQRKSISTIVRKEPETSHGSIHHFLKPLKLTLQNHFSDYWIKIFQSLTHYTRSLTETPSKLVIVV